MDAIRRDVAHALRTLGRNPGFTGAAALTLALGLGGNGAVFSWLDALLLRPFPFPDLERIVTVWEQHSEQGAGPTVHRHPMALADFADLATSSRTLESLASYRHREVVFTESGDPVRLQGALVSERFFAVLGAAPALGRLFHPEEHTPGRDAVVLVSHAFWSQRLGGETGVLGRTLSLDGRPHTIVGVMPRTFRYPMGGVEVWGPLAPATAERDERARLDLAVVGRLRRDVTLAAAQGEADAIATRLGESHPATNAGRRFALVRLREQQAGFTAPFLLVFQGAAALVLLIACVNVAGLLAARAVAREREMAVRLALGADRGRLARQLLTESAVLALLGAALALAFARAAVGAIRASLPPEIAQWVIGWDEIRLDPRGIAFTLALGLVTSLLFGLLPALRSSHPGLAEALQEGGRGAEGGPKARRARSALVIGQVTLSVVLLAGSGALIRGFGRLMDDYQGFAPDRVLTLRLRFPEWSHPGLRDAGALQERIVKALGALPGVEHAAAASHLPADLGPVPSATIAIGGRPEPSVAERPRADLQTISAAYFAALRVPLRSGRAFREGDGADAPPVAIVSETLARRFWPGEDPVGRTLRVDGPDPSWRTVVGVAADVKQYWFDREPRVTVYVPHMQAPRRMAIVLLRVAGDPTALASAARAHVAALDRRLAVDEVRTLAQVVAEAMAFLKTASALMAVLGAIALMLSAVGVYAVMADYVARRTREIALRMALGATAREVLRLVGGRAAGLAGIGVTLGLPAALALGRLMASVLFGVSSADAPVIAIAVGGVGISALAAALGPLRRAVRLEPAVALRRE